MTKSENTVDEFLTALGLSDSDIIRIASSPLDVTDEEIARASKRIATTINLHASGDHGDYGYIVN